VDSLKGRRIESVLVSLTALVLCLLAAHGRSTYVNGYVLLADAILHGHTWIDWPSRIIDAAVWNGRHYVIDAPLPAILLLPSVAILGTAANQTNLAIGGGVLAVALGWALLVRMRVARAPRLLLTIFLFAGTDLWWCSELGDTTFLAHIIAMCATFAALLEMFGKRRGWLIGIFAVLACEARFPLVMALPLYLCMSSGRRRAFAGVVGGGIAAWVAWNEAQWGLPYDIGHHIFFNQDSFGEPYGSPFQMKYLPYQLYSYFVRVPTFVQWGFQQTQWPFLKIETEGYSLTFGSPALILAALARGPIPVLLWATTIAVASPDFLYYMNGSYQVGMRHALDFEPFLLVLMAIGVRDHIPRWGSILCAWSALVGAWAVWYWNMAYRTGN
jgi:hypothetical protein